MSPFRISIGVLIGICFLACEFVAFWYFGLPDKAVPIIFLVIVPLMGGLFVTLQRHKALGKYWHRPCAGRSWRRQFPKSPKYEIREFLDLFVHAFIFSPKRRLRFLPTDKVMEVYQTVYSSGEWTDGMELETFCKKLKERYKIDLASFWRKDITLGEIFTKVTSQ